VGLIVVVLAVPALLPALALVLGGLHLLRRRSRLHRVQDPSHPHDGSPGQAGSPGGRLGIAMVVLGVVWGVAGLGLLVALLGPNL
jgi:hypothetical protein